MTRSISLAAVFAALAAAAAGLPSLAPACAPAPQKGEEVRISEESALIVWDEATKTEHFIRRATFQSTSADFGFLVPTPSKPDVGPADDAVFAQLATITAPKVETRVVRKQRTRAQPDGQTKSAPPMAAGGAGAPPPRGSVEVLDRKQFDGVEATVLAFKRGAGDADPTFGAEELATWLKKHGYEFGPTLVEWLKPYVANDWVMTAFRIAAAGPKDAGPGGPTGGSRSAFALRGVPVRMSFKTERPFYPYREPTDQREQPKAGSQFAPPTSRLLRVYLVSGGRVDGTLGDGKGASAWPGKTVWANKLTADQLRGVAAGAKLPKGGADGDLWLTEFEDRSHPRPGTDEVYFGAGKEQTPVARPPIIREIVEELDPPPEPDSGSGDAVPKLGLLTVVAGAVGLLLIGGFVYFIITVTRR